MFLNYNCSALRRTHNSKQHFDDYDNNKDIYWNKLFQRNSNLNVEYIRIGTCAYQEVRNVIFSENFSYVINAWFLIPIIGKKIKETHCNRLNVLAQVAGSVHSTLYHKYQRSINFIKPTCYIISKTADVTNEFSPASSCKWGKKMEKF